MFLLDMLANLPRLRLSSDHLQFILWMLKELGVSDVPSYKRFRHKQDELNKMMHICTQLKCSPKGGVFYQNNMADLLAIDWTNLETRAWLEEYPVRTTTVSESFHSQKWTSDIPSEAIAPMWCHSFSN
ncbi:hypothetical protein OBBRIDRAFT_739505 [Obba rivulosa]|uniref:Uncharacterized protein n=1 Tax=Obba rivulosa TaxID=1052685 RepID=A0A8E2ANW6_9APHY|nr:hypothetical protein OBBRIDRAFT_739505 [Obba rivulosa]